MEKYFDLVLDLLELDNQEELKMLARNLEKEQKA